MGRITVPIAPGEEFWARAAKVPTLRGHVSHVFAVRSEEQVVCVHAKRDVAPMENTRPFRNVAVLKFVCDSMRVCVPVDTPPKAEAAVPAIGAAKPAHTPVCVRSGNVLQKNARGA